MEPRRHGRAPFALDDDPVQPGERPTPRRTQGFEFMRLCRAQVLCSAGAECFCDSCQHELAATLDGRSTLNLTFPAAKRARAGRRICGRAAGGQAAPSARAAVAGCRLHAALVTAPPHLSPAPSHCQLLRPASLRPNAAAPHVRPPPPYAWPTSTQHPLDRDGSTAPPPDVTRAAAAALHNPHSELHRAAADDGACFLLHEHGRCFESGAAKPRPLRHGVTHTGAAGAVLQSRAARGCLQGGAQHWSFQAQKVAHSMQRLRLTVLCDRPLQFADAKANEPARQHEAAAVAVAALNVSWSAAAARQDNAG